MMHSLQELVAYLENSAWADSVRENDVLFPLIESVHVAAICLVVGSVLAVDFRLLGLASTDRPIGRVARGILPLTWAAFAVAVASGGLMFISNASKYLANGYFEAKICLIGLAGLNMAAFHLGGTRSDRPGQNGLSLPVRARVAGALSIVIWLAVVACGRWIGFTM